MVVFQRLWNFDCYCEQYVFVLCYICQSWSFTVGLDYKMECYCYCCCCCPMCDWQSTLHNWRFCQVQSHVAQKI